MSANIEAAWRSELVEARQAEGRGELKQAWRHLERAHVLSQQYALAHVLVHAHMLGFGVRRRDLREVRGQLARLVLAAPGSWLGRAPRGNTGGADVGMFTPMEIPADLRAMLEK